MRNLILLFARHGGIILFLLLQILCIYLTINFNQKQKEIAFNSANLFIGSLYETFDGVARYYDLSENADSLVAENARLRAQLRDAKFQETVLGNTVINKEMEQRYVYIGASVINNSIDRFNNSLTLNRGAEHGIKSRMGVIGIGNKGLIGIVKNTSKNYAQVMSILHQESRINVAIKRTGFFGPMVWDGRDPIITNMIDVPKHAQMALGDTVQTSGYSQQFPKGIMVGTVDTFWMENGSNFWTIKVKLVNDLSSVQYAYVVNNIMKEELETLEKEVKDE